MDTNKITTSQLILIVIIMMGLINSLMGCSTGKVVYDGGKGWKPMSVRSNNTGWNYK